MTDILVLIETRNGEIRPASLEAVGAARTTVDNLGGGTVIALATENFSSRRQHHESCRC